MCLEQPTYIDLCFTLNIVQRKVWIRQYESNTENIGYILVNVGLVAAEYNMGWHCTRRPARCRLRQLQRFMVANTNGSCPTHHKILCWKVSIFLYIYYNIWIELNWIRIEMNDLSMMQCISLLVCLFPHFRSIKATWNCIQLKHNLKFVRKILRYDKCCTQTFRYIYLNKSAFDQNWHMVLSQCMSLYKIHNIVDFRSWVTNYH